MSCYVKIWLPFTVSNISKILSSIHLRYKLNNFSKVTLLKWYHHKLTLGYSILWVVKSHCMDLIITALSSSILFMRIEKLFSIATNTNPYLILQLLNTKLTENWNKIILSIIGKVLLLTLIFKSMGIT